MDLAQPGQAEVIGVGQPDQELAEIEQGWAERVGVGTWQSFRRVLEELAAG